MTASIVSSAFLSRAHHDDAARHLAFAVELRDAATQLGPELQVRHVAEAHRYAGRAGAQRDASEVVEVPQVTRCSDDVFRLGELEHRAARLLVRAADRLDHLACVMP